MREDSEFQGSMQKIEALIGKLEDSADPATRANAKELVSALMDVHGGCLSRMVDVLKNSGEAGQAALRVFQSDPLVRNILILYELHPIELRERVEQAVDKFLGSYKAEDVTIRRLRIEDGIVRLQYASSTKGCGSGALKPALEAMLLEAAPDAAGIYVEDVNLESSPDFVPIRALQGAENLHSGAIRRSANPA